MKIGLKNFGAFENAEIELAPLTILCGANNTGKTYAMYAIYGLLGAYGSQGRLGNEEPLGIDLGDEGVTRVQLDQHFEKYWGHWHRRLTTGFKQSLSYFFSSEREFFAESELTISTPLKDALPLIKEMEVKRVLDAPNKKLLAEISKPAGSFELTITRSANVPKGVVYDMLNHMLLSMTLAPWRLRNSVRLLPAERSGLNLFYSELNRQRNALIHHASKPKVEPDKLFQDVFLARYPQPIADYIDTLNDMKNWKRQKGEYHDLAVELQSVLQGKFALDRDANVTFTPKRTRKAMSLHMTSSIVKTYFGLWFYLEHMAHKGDVLMIDEPELNLHPDNQRKLARLLVRLVKEGQRIIISTHSDYMIREFNNLILLGQQFEGKEALMKKYRYVPSDSLDPQQVKAYRFHDGKATLMEMDPYEGIIAKTFDDVINQMNASSLELSTALAMSKQAATSARKAHGA